VLAYLLASEEEVEFEDEEIVDGVSSAILSQTMATFFVRAWMSRSNSACQFFSL
jgi:hypothetical protein